MPVWVISSSRSTFADSMAVRCGIVIVRGPELRPLGHVVENRLAEVVNHLFLQARNCSALECLKMSPMPGRDRSGFNSPFLAGMKPSKSIASIRA